MKTNSKVKVTEGFTQKKLKEIKENTFKAFTKKAKYQGGEYLIEFEGKVIAAKTPQELFEKHIQLSRIKSHLSWMPFSTPVHIAMKTKIPIGFILEHRNFFPEIAEEGGTK